MLLTVGACPESNITALDLQSMAHVMAFYASSITMRCQSWLRGCKDRPMECWKEGWWLYMLAWNSTAGRRPLQRMHAGGA